MEMFVYYNGNFVKACDARVSIFDHGFLYGDGLFETLRVYEGVPFKFDEHMDRFYEGAQYLRIQIPLVRSVISKAIDFLIDKNDLYDAVVRVMITRGEGDIGIDIDMCTNPTMLITANPLSELPNHIYKEGVSLVVASGLKPPVQVINPAVKSNNYLANIIARAEARDKGAYDGIMLSIEGYVCECTTSNIFIVRNDEISTPALESGILNGITRTTIIEIANSYGVNVEQRFIFPEEIYDADECFITNSVREIMPVVRCDDVMIGAGKVGGLTSKLMTEYKSAVEEYIKVNADVE